MLNNLKMKCAIHAEVILKIILDAITNGCLMIKEIIFIITKMNLEEVSHATVNATYILIVKKKINELNFILFVSII